MPTSAPCELGKIKSLRSASSKENELIQLWKIIYESHQAGSKFGGFVYKPEFFNVLKKFSENYPKIKKVYGFNELLNATESSARVRNKAKRNELVRKPISTAARIVAGRARLIICRTKLDQREKAKAWITSNYENCKNLRRRPRIECLQNQLEKFDEGDFEPILKGIFNILIDKKECVGNKEQLTDLIQKIYKTQNNSHGDPPWYPDFREEPYFPNPDVVKCGHFLFALGSLGQGNLKGRWEKESLQFLLKNQTQEGYWSSSTFQFRPDNYATIVAMHTLGLWQPKGWEKAIKKAADWLWKQQRPDGSWELYEDRSQLDIVLSAIDLAEGEGKYSLKLSENAIEFVDVEESYESESSSYIEDNIEINNVSKYSPNLDEASVKGSFIFRPGQILFGGKDLEIKTGLVQDVLKTLVDNFGFVIGFKQLQSQSTDCEASVVLRSSISYLRKKLEKVPVKIENRRQSGYIISALS